MLTLKDDCFIYNKHKITHNILADKILNNYNDYITTILYVWINTIISFDKASLQYEFLNVFVEHYSD